MIEEKNPLKQGLKPDVEAVAALILAIEEKNPLKQGLKLEVWLIAKIVKYN